MKNNLTLSIMLVILLGAGLGGQAVQAADMRLQAVEIRQKEARFLEQARQEKERAEAEDKVVRQAIMADRDKLTTAITRLEKERQELLQKKSSLLQTLFEVTAQKKALASQVEQAQAQVQGISGQTRQFAKKLQALVNESPQTALAPERDEFLKKILSKEEFGGLGELEQILALALSEISASGEVRLSSGNIINRSGQKVTAEILSVGNFSLAYRTDHETGWLLYSAQSRQLFALSQKASWATRSGIDKYMSGQTPALPLDISSGAALRQLAQKSSLLQRIASGGPLIYPILAIFILAGLIVTERMVFLYRRRLDATALMEELTPYIASGQAREGAAECLKYSHQPIARVLQAGLEASALPQNELENVLQETILREIPHLERFLSTLGMLATIAPLLGLLGTVTGMINTFHAITFFGSGDAKMMSGGISEALVTTMLGLSAAIPIMLCHSLLARRVESMIATMEEKAVSLINSISKAREA